MLQIKLLEGTWAGWTVLSIKGWRVAVCFANCRTNIPNDKLVKRIFTCRLPAKNDPAPPLGNFADKVYLKEQSFLHRIRDVCTL